MIGILPLDFKKDGKYEQKIGVSMEVKGIDREVGHLEFDVEVTFKTKEDK